MKLAANLSTLFTELPLAARAAAAQQAGFNTVEVQFPYELSIDHWQQTLQQNRLRLCLINAPAGDLMQGGAGLAAVPNKREEFKTAVVQAYEYAAALKPAWVNVLAGAPKVKTAPERLARLNLLAENLNWAINLFSNLDTQIITEVINPYDLPDFLLADFGAWDYLSTRVPGLGLQLDFYHTARLGLDPIAAYHQYQHQIKHIQFADCPGRHEPGTGDIDFRLILAELENYQGYLAAEYFPKTDTQSSLAWVSEFKV